MMEQLHYSWSINGLQGMARFQVTAASPGLQNLSSDLALLALRLCRWSRDPSCDPVSYGWINVRGYRFVFKRAAAGVAPDGRPGNFTAHVIVARQDELPEYQLVQEAAPDLWWDGHDESTTLPTLSAQPLRPPGRGSPQEVKIALAQILHSGFTGRINAHWAALLSAATLCVQTLPWALEHVEGFSTYESSETAPWFTLCGAAPRIPEPHLPEVALQAAQLLVSDDCAARDRISLLARAAAVGPGAKWHCFLTLSHALQATLAEPADGDSTTLHTLLENAITAEYMLSTQVGLDQTALHILRPNRRLAEAVGKVAPSLPQALLGRLGASLGEKLLAQNLGHIDWGQITQLLINIDQATLNGAAQVLRSRVALGTNAPTRLLAACLRMTEPEDSDFHVRTLVSMAAHAPDVIIVATDKSIPGYWRAAVMDEALRTHNLRPHNVAEVIIQDTDLRLHLIPRLPMTILFSILDVVDAAAPFVMKEAAPKLKDDVLLNVLERLLPTLSAMAADDLLRGIHSRTHLKNTPRWKRLQDDCLDALLRDQLEQKIASLSPMVLMQACSRSSYGRAWSHLLSDIQEAQSNLSRVTCRRVGLTLESAALKHGMHSRAYAIEALLPACSSREAISELVKELYGQTDESATARFAAAAIRQINCRADYHLAVLVLDYAARTGDLKDFGAAPELVHELSDAAWVALERRTLDAPSASRRYLRSVRGSRVRRALYRGFRTVSEDSRLRNRT
jgi:hypothetical protein